MLDGELFAGVLTKTMRIEDLEGEWCVYSGSMFTLDTTILDWYSQEFIELYKSFNTNQKGNKLFLPYLIRNPKLWVYS